MKLAVMALCVALTGCATTCTPPDPPVWAMSTTPDEATFEQQVLYLIAENEQLHAHVAEWAVRCSR